MPSDADYHDPEAERPQQDTLRIENEALRRGFTLIPNYVLRARTISRDAKLLYGILLSYAWQKGNCWPGYDTLMEDLQCGRPQLAKYIKELKDTGLVQVQRRGQGLTSIYTIKDVQPENLQKFRNETSGSFEMKRPVVSKRNGEENEVEEDTVEENEVISKERDPSVFHSKYNNAQLSTMVRERTDVDNPPAAGLAEPVPSPPTGWERLGSVAQSIARRQSRPPAPTGGHETRRGRPPKADYIAAVVEEISGRLHDDPKHTRSNITRATRLWQASGLDERAFVEDILYKARSLAQAQGNVTKRAGDGSGLRNKVPYFFAVVEDLLGLKDSAAGSS